MSLEEEIYQNQFQFKRPKFMEFYGPKFVGLVLRNLPKDYDYNEISFLLNNHKIENYLDEQVFFGGMNLALLRFQSIEDAEKAYYFLADKKLSFGNHELKINIHSASNFTRQTPNSAHFGEIFSALEETKKQGKILHLIKDY